MPITLRPGHDRDAHRDRAHRAGDIVGEADDAGRLGAGRRLQLVERHDRAGPHLHDLAADAEILEHRLEQAGVLLQRRLVDLGFGRAARRQRQQIERRKPVMPPRSSSRWPIWGALALRRRWLARDDLNGRTTGRLLGDRVVGQHIGGKGIVVTLFGRRGRAVIGDPASRSIIAGGANDGRLPPAGPTARCPGRRRPMIGSMRKPPARRSNRVRSPIESGAAPSVAGGGAGARLGRGRNLARRRLDRRIGRFGHQRVAGRQRRALDRDLLEARLRPAKCAGSYWLASISPGISA